MQGGAKKFKRINRIRAVFFWVASFVLDAVSCRHVSRTTGRGKALVSCLIFFGERSPDVQILGTEQPYPYVVLACVAGCFYHDGLVAKIAMQERIEL